MKNFDLVIIGSGPAGHTAALEAAKKKIKTALIERDMNKFGGVCLNEGCIPLKGLLYHSHHEKDYLKIRDSVMQKVSQIKAGLLSRVKNLGVEIIGGEAKFVSAGEIEVKGEKITAKNFIIAAGSVPKKLFGKEVFTSEKAFELSSAPAKVLIIGGGVIGCEYASFFSNIGCAVTLAEAMDSLIPGEDEEVSRTLAREFKKKKINVQTGAKVAVNGAEAEIGGVKDKYDIIFETTGRKPNLEPLNLQAAGVALTQRGFIKTDALMKTGAKGIYACGDCVETPMLAYTASKEAEIAVGAIAGENPAPADYVNCPKIVFSCPQAGSAGLTEKQAKEAGINFIVKKYFFKAIGKAVVESKDAGFIKILIDPAKDTVIGAAGVGDELCEVMNELAVIIKSKIKVKDLLEVMHVHPSYAEIIIECLKYG